ncbi:hypothetical protein NL487_29455, partial [Klebsiella pneumoniae]|nr:hypothetical protein [Klebsiella pneumoniae]
GVTGTQLDVKHIAAVIAVIAQCPADGFILAFRGQAVPDKLDLSLGAVALSTTAIKGSFCWALHTIALLSMFMMSDLPEP